MSDEKPLPDAEIVPEPAWIRDHDKSPAGGGLIIEIDSEEGVAKLCEGEQVFCAFCGNRFPLWPMYEIAKHSLDEHGAELTVQGQNGYKMQMIPGLTQSGVVFIQALLMSRISLRRRSWQLGFIREAKPGDGPRIVQPGESRRGRIPN